MSYNNKFKNFDINNNFFGEPDEEVRIKVDEYYKYITEHIDNVKECWAHHIDNITKYFADRDCGIKLCESVIGLVTRHIEFETHDNSKISFDEFNGYRVKFFPTKKEEEKMKTSTVYEYMVNVTFNKAWAHHIRLNPHHPEHWVIPNDNNKPNTIIDMDIEYIIEMLMDWEAMGKKFGGNAYSYWYDTAKKSKANLFNEFTINYIEDILDYIK